MRQEHTADMVIQSAEQIELTYSQIVKMLAEHVLDNEKAYFTAIRSQYNWSPDELNNIAQLLTFADQRKLAAQEFRANANTNVLMSSNALVYMFDGPCARGKTAFADALALHLSRRFGLEYYADIDFTKQLDKPSVIVLNDPAVFTNVEKFNTFFDHLPPVSVLFITCNMNFSRKYYSLFSFKHLQNFLTQFTWSDLRHPLKLWHTFLNMRKVYYQIELPMSPDLNHYNFDGVFRRLGIMQDVKIKHSNSFLPKFSTVKGCFDNYGKPILVDDGGTMYSNGVPLSRDKIFSDIVSKVTRVIRSRCNKVLTKGKQVNVYAYTPDVHLIIHDRKSFIEKSQISFGLTQLVLNQYPTIAQCLVSHHYRENFSDRTKEGTLELPTLPVDASVDTILEIVAYALRRADPTCVLKLTIEHVDYIIVDNSIHELKHDDKVAPQLVGNESGILFYRGIPLSCADYVALRLGVERFRTIPRFSHLTDQEIRDLTICVENKLNHQPVVYGIYRASWNKYNKQTKTNIAVIDKACEHKHMSMATKIFGVLMAALSFVIMMWFIKQKFFPSKEEEEKIQSNSDQKYQRVGEAMRRFLRSTDLNKTIQWEQYAKQQGFSDSDLLDYDRGGR